MDDLISRQAILKHIEKMRQSAQMMDDTHRADIIMMGMHLCEEAVRNQPSAQPEIIRCKDCKYGSPNGKYGCKCYHYRLYEAHEMKPEDFCSHAERRTDE